MRVTFLSGLFLAGVGVAGCTPSDVRRADNLAETGQWDEAVALYRQAARQEPFDPTIQHRLDQAKTHAAEHHYAEGRRALEDNRVQEAVREFKLALGLDPSRSEHQAALGDALRLREARDQLQAADKLQGLGRLEEAMAAYERAVELDPGLSQALDGITAVTNQQRAAKAIGSTSQPITLRFQNAKLKEVFEVLARTAGVNVIFDREVRDDPITMFIKDMPFDEALNLILNTNTMLAQRIGPDTLLIMPNTKQKQAQYQDLMIRAFYLSNAKAKDVVNLIRTMLESKRVYVDEKINALVIREEPAKLQLAERVILAVDRREPEVELDLEVLEVNRTKSLKYGFNFAKTAGLGVIPPGSTGGSISTAPTQFTYQQLTSLGPQSYLFTLPAGLLLDFFKQESDAKTLAAPKLRVLNNKSASINIGDKQPILLSTTNVLPGQAATGAVPTTSTVTSIEFKDTGVKLTVEPTVHLVDDLTLKLKVEVTRLGDQVTLQASPEIKQFKFGTRSAETILMMKDDETVVLAGLIQDEERKTRVKVPVLGDIPILGQLFTSTNEETVATEVILTITPHIVRNLATPGIETQAFWSGTESNFATAPLFSPQLTTASQKPSGGAQPATQLVPQSVSPSSTPPLEARATPSQPADSGAATVQVTAPIGAQSGSPAAASPISPVAPTQPDLVARGTGVLAIRPAELSTVIGREFRVDLTAEQFDSFTESLVTVTFDPQTLEFRRALPAAATVAARATPGQVSLTLRRQGPPTSGGGVLAMLFFQAKAQGDAPITLQAAPGSAAGGQSPSVSTEPALVHVR